MKYESIKKRIKSEITQADLKIFLIIFIAGILIHFLLYSQNIVAYDGYWHNGSFISKGWEISLGRFMLPFSDILRGTVVCSFLSTIISISLVSITNIFLCKTLNINKKYLMILSGLILLSIPSFSLTLMYPYTSDSYTYALFFSVLSIYLLNKNKKIYCIICIVLSMGFYQAYIGVLTTLYLITKIFKMLECKDSPKVFYKKVVIDILTILIGLIIYYVCLKIITSIFHINISEYSGGNKIISIDTIKNIISSIIGTYRTFYKFYFTDSIVVNTDFFAMKIINLFSFVIIIINFIYYFISTKTLTIWKIVTLLFLIMFYPIVCCIIQLIAIDREINLLMATPLYFMLIVLIKQIDCYYKVNIIKILSILFVSLVIWIYILVDNATYIASAMFKNQMSNVGNRILYSVSRDEDYNSETDLCIAGKMIFNIHNENLLKITYFDVSDVNIWTWQIFLKDNLGSNKKINLSNTYEDILNSDEYYNMSIFPDKNSIKKINDIMVVKVGY